MAVLGSFQNCVRGRGRARREGQGQPSRAGLRARKAGRQEGMARTLPETRPPDDWLRVASVVAGAEVEASAGLAWVTGMAGGRGLMRAEGRAEGGRERDPSVRSRLLARRWAKFRTRAAGGGRALHPCLPAPSCPTLTPSRPPSPSLHPHPRQLTMGKAKKTRKFAAVKRMLNPADPRLSVLVPACPPQGHPHRARRADPTLPGAATPNPQQGQRREGLQEEAGGEGG